MKNTKLLKFLFACCLFLAVGTGCLKSAATHIIRDAYIGSAFSFRTNDVVALACPGLEIDKQIEIQQLVEGHPQLDHIIHRYLCAYAAFLSGKDSPLEKMDNSRFFANLNRDILKAVKKGNHGNALVISDEEFLVQLTAAENEVEWILQSQLPPTLRNRGESAIGAIRAYGTVTSPWIQAALLLGVLMPILMPVILYAKKRSAAVRGYYRSLGKITLLQGCFWVIVPFACIKAADRWVLSVTDRLLGRSMFLDASPFLWRVTILVVCGGAVWFLASKFSIGDTNKTSAAPKRKETCP